MRPVIASTSESFSVSAEINRATIWVSKYQPDGKSGRIGRSMSRLVKHLLLGRFALPLEEASRNTAGCVGVLAIVDREREKVDTDARRGGVTRGDDHHRVAGAHDDRAVGLLGQFAGLDRDGAASRR